jgi:hypothetical protein
MAERASSERRDDACLECRDGEVYVGVLGHLLDADGLRLEVGRQR